MNLRTSLRAISTACVGIVVTASTAVACPDCTLQDSGGIIEPQTVMAKLAFSASTVLLMAIVFSAIGFLVWSMVKACRDLNKERPLSHNDGR